MKILKNRIFLVLVTAIIATTITAYATISPNSESIIYDNTNSGIESTNMQDAIDELYAKANSSSGGVAPTLLWENTDYDPTIENNTYTFPDTTITIPGLSNYEFILIEYIFDGYWNSTTTNPDKEKGYAILETASLNKSTWTSNNHPERYIGGGNPNNYAFIRIMHMVSSNQLYISRGTYLNYLTAQMSPASGRQYIPLKIYGLSASLPENQTSQPSSSGIMYNSVQEMIDGSELIASGTFGSSTTTTVTVPDLSQYKWLIMYSYDFNNANWSDYGKIPNVILLSYEEFKLYTTRWYAVTFHNTTSAGGYEALMYYISDTSVGVVNGSSSGKPWYLKGIK